MALVMLKVNRFTLALGAAIALLAVSAAHAEDGEYGVLMKTLANPFWGAWAWGREVPRRPGLFRAGGQSVGRPAAANVCNTMLG